MTQIMIKFIEKLNAQASSKFDASLPYLEKAYNLEPKDKNTLLSLKQLYYLKGDYKKSEEMKKNIAELKVTKYNMRIKIFFFTLITSSILSIEIYSQNIFNNKKTKEVVKVDEFTKKTKGCETYNGLFNIYQNKKDEKAYIEIDTSHLDKEFIYFSYFEKWCFGSWIS